MGHDPEATAILPDRTEAHTEVDGAEVGTNAASPKAIAEAAAGSSLGPLDSAGDGRPSNWATASHRTQLPPTAAEALGKSDLARSRMFHVFLLAYLHEGGEDLFYDGKLADLFAEVESK